MAGGDGTTVTPDELRAHATHVSHVAGRVALARQAGGVVRLDAQAYGKLCVVLPTALGHLQDAVLDALDSANTSLNDTVERLRTAAASYENTDVRARNRLRGD
ncbi:type VII secretion target [Luedemannella helvata]|uniref:ESX-1 secretion-associated protein n=1 Tax=Luedemannella helvata TaxID=349315 RepID=A0ABP4X9Y7_9ACTN